jgi:hypothetical protein
VNIDHVLALYTVWQCVVLLKFCRVLLRPSSTAAVVILNANFIDVHAISFQKQKITRYIV